MNTYFIHEDNIDRLEAKLLRIQHKCQKYGLDFHYNKLGETFKEVKNDAGQFVIAKFIEVEVEGTAKLNNWEFIGTVDHTDNGNIIRNYADVEVPERYRYSEPVCEHCNSHRARRNTYIVRNTETGEFKQVGSSCLADYTSGLSAEMVAGYISMFDEMMQFEALPVGSHFTQWYDVREILIYAAQFVNDLGYISSQSENKSTKEYVLETWRYDHHQASTYEADSVSEYRRKFHPDYQSASLNQYVDELLEYFKSLDPKELNDYMFKLHVICSSPYITYSHIGYAVSAISTYHNYLERSTAAKKEADMFSQSEYVGNVKDKVTVNDPTAEVVSSWEGMYGITVRYRIVSDGNVFMWDTGCCIDLDKHIASITGTVKKHEEYRDVKQTWLTRCKVTYA